MSTFEFSQGPVSQPDLTSVKIDGFECAKAIRGFTVVAAAGQMTHVELTLAAWDATDINDAWARILLAPESEELLRRLGWTSPSEAKKAPAAPNDGA